MKDSDTYILEGIVDNVTYSYKTFNIERNIKNAYFNAAKDLKQAQKVIGTLGPEDEEARVKLETIINSLSQITPMLKELLISITPKQ